MRLEISRENPFNKGYFYSYLDLPAEEHEIQDALQKARIPRTDSSAHLISITESPYINLLTELRLDSPSIDELNYLSKRIQKMDGISLLVYDALVDYLSRDDELVSMKDLINCTYNLDEVPVAVDISNDAQLGAFIIENEMHEDVNAVPESSLYLLDHRKIGELYRKNFGTVYNTGLCVFAGDFEIPEVYNESQLLEEAHSTGFAFRLPIDIAPGEKHDRLNSMVAEMSQNEQAKFKAVLELEKPTDIDGILDAADNLHQYEFDCSVGDDDDFFKRYLATHLDTHFDTQWLDTLIVRAEGSRLLDRLGAMVTDYGAISARGRSLYEIVPYNKLDTVDVSYSEDSSYTQAENEPELQMGGMQMG